MTPTALTARLLLFMRYMSPEQAAIFCELVHDLIENAMMAEKLPDVKGMELIATIMKIAADRQRQALAEHDECHNCGKPATHTAGGFRWCSSRCELSWLRGRA